MGVKRKATISDKAEEVIEYLRSPQYSPCGHEDGPVRCHLPEGHDGDHDGIDGHGDKVCWDGEGQ